MEIEYSFIHEGKNYHTEFECTLCKKYDYFDNPYGEAGETITYIGLDNIILNTFIIMYECDGGIFHHVSQSERLFFLDYIKDNCIDEIEEIINDKLQ